jgi:DNA mismatch repair protein MutS2
MDTHTLELLEFDKVRAMVAARAACSLGKAAALAIEPSTKHSEIQDRQALTREMVEALAAGLRPPFGGLHDISNHVHRAQKGGALEPEELAETLETLRAIANLDKWIARIGNQFPRLGCMRQGIGEYAGLVAALEGCLDDRGKVLDTASRRLSGLRREAARVQERIQETLRQMLRSSEIRRALRFPNFTMVGHHYVLPVSKDHRGEISGSVLRTSASNETVYVEPTAIGEQSAQLSFLRAREAKEVRRILRWLSAQVGMVAESLLRTLETLTELDLAHARAKLSADYRMSAPHWNDEGRLVLRAARHPLLEALFKEDPALIGTPSFLARRGASIVPGSDAPGSQAQPVREQASGSQEQGPAAGLSGKRPTVVPIDLSLGARFQILVVTGPNTGGKTVALKTVGLLAIMAQAGLHVPADEGSDFPVFDDVLADIGDEQSLEQSLSTFSSHVGRITQILDKATAKSLVLLDELGAGTDPADGAALGRAILDELGALGCRAIVTTHIGDLKTYAFTNSNAENAAVEFDHETLRPRYRLLIGDIGESNALAIARQLRLSDRVVERAESYLAQRGSRSAADWEIVQKLRMDANLAREAALQSQAEAERTREALAERLAQLHQEAEGSAAIAEARARLQPGDKVVVPRLGFDRPGRLVKLDQRRKTAIVAIGHVTWNVAIDELIPQTKRASSSAGPDSPSSPPRTSSPRGAISLDDFEPG